MDTRGRASASATATLREDERFTVDAEYGRSKARAEIESVRLSVGTHWGNAPAGERYAGTGYYLTADGRVGRRRAVDVPLRLADVPLAVRHALVAELAGVLWEDLQEANQLRDALPRLPLHPAPLTQQDAAKGMQP